MPLVARQMSSCQPGRRAWASSYSRNSRTRPQSRDIHFRLWGVSRSERRGGEMKSRMIRERAREAMVSSGWCKQFMQALLAILLFSVIAAAQQEPEVGDQTESLQKATQNPVASLISVPLQNNTNFGVNPGYRNQDVLNIQPVIPIGISKDWNLLVRCITPIIYQPAPNAPGTPETGEHGLGDMEPTFFISPRKPGKVIWGVRPVFQLPTATNRYLGQGKLGTGPSIVALTQPRHWTLGGLANNVWSVAGSRSRPDMNQFLTHGL